MTKFSLAQCWLVANAYLSHIFGVGFLLPENPPWTTALLCRPGRRVVATQRRPWPARSGGRIGREAGGRSRARCQAALREAVGDVCGEAVAIAVGCRCRWRGGGAGERERAAGSAHGDGAGASPSSHASLTHVSLELLQLIMHQSLKL